MQYEDTIPARLSRSPVKVSPGTAAADRKSIRVPDVKLETSLPPLRR